MPNVAKTVTSRKQPLVNVPVAHAESERPLVQIGNQVFAGAYQDTIGTSLFFAKEERPPGSTHDPVFGGREAKTRLTYLAGTKKKLHLKRVFLKERPNGGEQKAGVAEENADIADTETNCSDSDTAAAAASSESVSANMDI